MRGESQIVIGKRTKTITFMERVRDFLYENGPHSTDQLADHFDVTDQWMRDVLRLMREEGTLSVFQKNRVNYWIIYEDALAA